MMNWDDWEILYKIYIKKIVLMKKKRLYQILNTYMDIFEMMVLKSSFLLSSILHLFDQKYSKTLTL